MNNTTKSLLIAGAAVIVIAGAVFAGHRIYHPAGFHHGEAGGFHGGGFHGRFAGPRRGRFGGGQRLFGAFDSDKDDVLTQAEVDKVRGDQFAKFDANGDGALSLQEYGALWSEAMRERMVDRFQRHDDDGDAKVTPAEFNKRFAGVVDRLDGDGDGKLTRAELRERRLSGHGRGRRRGG
jgi:hypothetical protein